jgi:hypothetical protein
MKNQFQHYTREQKAIKLDSVCRSQYGIMFRLHELLDNPTFGSPTQSIMTTKYINALY